MTSKAKRKFTTYNIDNIILESLLILKIVSILKLNKAKIL